MACRFPVTALLALASASCVDPRARFDEFVDRVPDAAATDPVDAADLDEVPDISGTFLLGFAPVIQPDTPIQFLWTVTSFARNPDGTATIEATAQPLHVDTREAAGALYTVAPMQISKAGQFEMPFVDMAVDGAANPVTGSDLMVTMKVSATIKSKDRVCGTCVEGGTTSPAQLDLTTSTWSAIRVPPGTTGQALPPVEVQCPSDTPDAGPPDATGPDGSPDAAATDAAGTDV